jgi:hypothetical protein
MIQVVESFSNMHETLSLTFSKGRRTRRKKIRRRRRRGRRGEGGDGEAGGGEEGKEWEFDVEEKRKET